MLRRASFGMHHRNKLCKKTRNFLKVAEIKHKQEHILSHNPLLPNHDPQCFRMENAATGLHGII